MKKYVKTHYSGVMYDECINGEGWGCTIFLSGCKFHCENCQNKQAWDFSYGEELKIEDIINLTNHYKNNPWLDRITICGGEPLCEENIQATRDIASTFKTILPDIEVWCYSGHTFEELSHIYNVDEVLTDIDILIDGRFDKTKTKPRPLYRGSYNQRIINVQRTLVEGKIIIKKVK